MRAPLPTNSDHPIVLFDGVCNLCNGSVRFIIDRDPKDVFRFAPLQSTAGERLLAVHGREANSLSSIVLVEGDRIYDRSTAALRIARRLSFPWPLLFGFVVVPRIIRDAFYDVIAKNRYRWFGKSETCRLPKPSEQAKFLDDPANVDARS